MVVSCGRKHPEDKVTYVAGDDPKMNEAIEKARSSVQSFIIALKAAKPGQSAFSVKMAFTDGSNTEHIWLTPVSYDGKRFHGTINNEPETVKNVRFGQKASVEVSKISDWMYVEKRKLVGGYTLRVLRDGLPPNERAAFDKTVPFSFE
jgi:uncharacterized protein YegJ (DUF2314 family)